MGEELQRRVVEQAPTEEAQQAWLREFQMENRLAGDRVRASTPRRRKFSASPERTRRRLVGHRTLLVAGGQVKVPVFEDADGTHFYTSPQTDRRVAVPKW